MTPGGCPARLAGAAAVLLALAWLAATAWVRPLMVPDEGRYVGVAWEMLRSGNWLVPTLDGLPYFHKPPLFYWLTAASLSTFGMNEWAARLAPFLGAATAAVGLHAFARRWADARTANFALLVLVTQPLFFLGAQYANLDMLVGGCVTAAILASAHVVLQAREGQAARGALALAYLFAALGFLAKGLIGVALPVMVMTVWLLVLRQWRLALSLLGLPGLALFLLVGLPWLAAMQAQFPDFAYYFFVVQHFKRYADAGFNNSQPFWFYPAALALATLPWSLWLPAAAFKRYWADRRLGPVRVLMWIWLITITAFFSLPESKIIGYLLPVAVPLAYLIGDAALHFIAARPWFGKLWQLSAVAAAIACLSAIAWTAANPGKSLRSLGQALAQQAAPGEPLLFLHDYYFDIAFYARSGQAARVVEDWDDPEIERRDNWGKELLDAKRFASGSRAQVLVAPAAVEEAVCAATPTWLIGNWKVMPRYPALARAREIARSGEMVLWRLPGGSAAGGADNCASASPTPPAGK
ncbi:MAG: glycosyltransferase family 39 protein [Ramlibacter sp.]